MSNKRVYASLLAHVYIGTNPHRNLTAPNKEGNEQQIKQPENHPNKNR